mgnify:CR=1 FL=1
MKDYYAILGVTPQAEDVVIKAAYRALAQRYHPDRFVGSPEEALTRPRAACIAARYLPAARALGVGGDWYGVEEIDDHESVLVVGDVVGHGITAVVDMVEISAMIAAMSTGRRGVISRRS